MKRVRVLLGCVLLTIFAAMSNHTGASAAGDLPLQTSKAANAQRKKTIIDLKSVEPLKEAFQRDSGKIRLVALISPT
jgi:hypothetical protein